MTRMSSTDQILELVIGEPAHGGACVARDESGRVVFVRHTLPGERVRARVTSARSHLAWADAIEILEPSADRVDSVWPQAGPLGVGGGELAHVAPRAQRQWKESVISTQLRRVGGADLAQAVDALGGVKVEAAPGDEHGPLLHRRTRIELVIDALGRAGMHRYRSKDIIALDSMPLAVEAIETLGLWGEDSPWRQVWRPGERVRIVAPDATSPLVITPRAAYRAPDVPCDDRELVWHVNLGSERLEYRVRADGFWQTHLVGASVLASAVLEAAHPQPGDHVLELFSGAGLFSLPLAKAIGEKGRLVSLEGDEGAVADAGHTLSCLPWAQPYIGTVNVQGICDLGGELRAVPSCVILDPPRSGAGRPNCEAIAGLGAPRIVLVSCDPAAGARDMRDLMHAGYEISQLQAWDLFPHTHHVEMLTVLTRRAL